MLSIVNILYTREFPGVYFYFIPYTVIMYVTHDCDDWVLNHLEFLVFVYISLSSRRYDQSSIIIYYTRGSVNMVENIINSVKVVREFATLLRETEVTKSDIEALATISPSLNSYLLRFEKWINEPTLNMSGYELLKKTKDVESVISFLKKKVEKKKSICAQEREIMFAYVSDGEEHPATWYSERIKDMFNYNFKTEYIESLLNSKSQSAKEVIKIVGGAVNA